MRQTLRPSSPSPELVAAIVAMKTRNARFGSRRIGTPGVNREAVLGEDSTDDVFVDIDAEGKRELLGLWVQACRHALG